MTHGGQHAGGGSPLTAHPDCRAIHRFPPMDEDTTMHDPAPAEPRLRLDQSSVAELNGALRIYRRLPLDLLGMLVLLVVLLLGLPRLSAALAPPYGFYVFGMGLTEWGLLALLAAMFGLFRWRGRQVGTLLQDPVLMAAPVGALLHGIGVIAARAKAMGMEWSGFFGPLRPSRSKP